ncbi:cytochrome P450 [Streptomyces sp. NPDC055709]
MMREIAQDRVEAWRDGQEVRMDQELFDLALTTVTRVLFSTRLGDEGTAVVYCSLPVLLEGLGRRAAAPIDLLDKLPTVMNHRFTKALSLTGSVVEDIISESRSRGTETADLLAALLMARDEDTGEGMSDEEVYDEVVTMLIAGTETTAGALSWACYLLSQHPHIQQRLQDELDSHLGERNALFEDLGKLPFLQQVIAETLRLHPSTWMLMRSPVTDVELGGHLLPAGSIVLFSIYALQRDPSLRPEPGGVRSGPLGARTCRTGRVAPAQTAIDIAHILRRLWAGDAVAYHGPAGHYLNLRLAGPPQTEYIPLLMAALGPRSLELAGQHFEA